MQPFKIKLKKTPSLKRSFELDKIDIIILLNFVFDYNEEI